MDTDIKIIPNDLVDAVKHLSFENPSDKVFATKMIANPTNSTNAMISWLAALVKRKGVRFNGDNPRHCGPTEWPIE